MSESNVATASQGGNGERFADLHSFVGQAVEFAEEWPETYRARAFDLALERLQSGAVVRGVSAAPVVASPVTAIETGGVAALARELAMDPRALSRVLAVGEDGTLDIIGRAESRKNARMQMEFSLVYAYAKERVFGQMDVPSEELRALCQAKGCYNKDHFSDCYSRSDLISPVGEGKTRAYRLSKKGVEVAKELLKKMVES